MHRKRKIRWLVSEQESSGKSVKREQLATRISTFSSTFASFSDSICLRTSSHHLENGRAKALLALPLAPALCCSIPLYCLTLYCPIINTIWCHELPYNKNLYGGLILGINTLYRLLCFFKLFLWSVKG